MLKGTIKSLTLAAMRPAAAAGGHRRTSAARARAAQPRARARAADRGAIELYWITT